MRLHMIYRKRGMLMKVSLDTTQSKYDSLEILRDAAYESYLQIMKPIEIMWSREHLENHFSKSILDKYADDFDDYYIRRLLDAISRDDTIIRLFDENKKYFVKTKRLLSILNEFTELSKQSFTKEEFTKRVLSSKHLKDLYKNRFEFFEAYLQFLKDRDKMNEAIDEAIELFAAVKADTSKVQNAIPVAELFNTQSNTEFVRFVHSLMRRDYEPLHEEALKSYSTLETIHDSNEFANTELQQKIVMYLEYLDPITKYSFDVWFNRIFDGELNVVNESMTFDAIAEKFDEITEFLVRKV